MQKKHVLYYDIIKIVAAYMVCFYHLGMLDLGTVTETFYVPNFNRLVLNLCAMSVPLFFMVNGALMLRRSYSVKEVAIKFIKFLFLYYFWVLVIGKIGEFFFDIAKLSIREILEGYRNTITVHLWFFKTIARLAILTPLFKLLYDHRNKRWLYLIMACLFICPFVYNYFVLFASWFEWKPFNNLPVTGVDTMYSVLYFFLGKIISDMKPQENNTHKKYKISALISIIAGWLMVSVEVTLWSNIQGSVYDGVNSSFPTIGALLMAAGTFYLFSQIDFAPENRGKKVIKLLADNIMGVYVFHPIVIRWIRRIYKGVVPLGIKCILTLVIIVGLAIFTNILKKIPVVRKTVEM